MAEIILKTKLKLMGILDVKVKSAGLSTLDGQKMSQNSSKALKLMGYKPYGFKSRQLTRPMLEKSDLVLCMTVSHKNALNGFNNVYTIDEVTGIGEIKDPYGGNINTYIKTSHQIEDACNIILENILKVKGEQ
jgi:protein-tyrosine phosphatase